MRTVSKTIASSILLLSLGMPALGKTPIDFQVVGKTSKYSGEISEVIVWNLPGGAHAEIQDYQFTYLLKDAYRPWWDVFDLFETFHEGYGYERITEPYLSHSPNLIIFDDESIVNIKVNNKELRTCVPTTSPFHSECSGRDKAKYENFKDDVENGTPISVTPHNGTTFLLQTKGIMELIESTKSTALTKYESVKSTYENQKFHSLWKAAVSTIVAFTLILAGGWLAYIAFKKLIRSIKQAGNSLATQVNTKLTSTSGKRYKLGIAQELEILKRLEQQGEISAQDYEQAKRKLIAHM